MMCSLITSAPVLVIHFHEVPLRTWVESGIYYAALVAAIVSSRKALNIAALGLLIAAFAYAAVMSFIQPPQM